jgi:hypothetical protein
MPLIIWIATYVILSFFMTEIYKYELAILMESVHGKSQKSFCIKKLTKINNNYNKTIIKILLTKLSFKNSRCKIIFKNFLSDDRNKKMSWQNEDTTTNKKNFILYLVATVTEFEKH